MPSFAAVIPNYNDSARIEASLATLFGQTHPFDEIIIVDDGSTDGSIALIEKLSLGRPQVRFIRHEKNQGVVVALNTGIAACGSDFVIFCSSNDAYDLRMVEHSHEALKLHPSAGMVAGNSLLSFQNKNEPVKTILRPLSLPQETRYYSPQEMVAEQRRAPTHYNGGANMLRLSRVREFGGLSPEMQWHCDWLMYNLIAFTDGIIYVPEIFSIVLVDGKKSYSSNINIWKKQKPVLETLFKILPARYPALVGAFRQSALLPAFHLGNPFLLLRKDIRWFTTPLLLWRVVMHKLFYGLKNILPRPFLMRIRTWIGI